MKDIDKIKLLKPTAKSIFEIAKQLNMVDKIYNELSKCSELFKDEDIKKYLSDKEIDDCFDYEYYLRNIDLIMKRFGI